MGPRGVVKTIEIIIDELKEVLAMVGCGSVKDASEEYLEEITVSKF